MACGKGLCITVTTLLLLGAPIFLIVALVYGNRVGADPYGSNVEAYNAAVKSWKGGASLPFLVTESGAMVRGPNTGLNLTFQLAPVADALPSGRSGPIYPDLDTYDSLSLSARLMSIGNGSGMFPDQYFYPSQYMYLSQPADLYVGQAVPTRVTLPVVTVASMPADCPSTATYFNGYTGCKCAFGYRTYGNNMCLVTMQLTGLCIVVDPSIGLPAAFSQAGAGCAPFPVLPDGRTIYTPPSLSTCLPSSAAQGTTALVYKPVNLTSSATLKFTNFSVELRSVADPHALAVGLTRGTLDFGASPDGLARLAAVFWTMAAVCGLVALSVIVCVASPVCDRGVANARSYLAARRARIEMQQAAAAAAAGPRIHMTDREEAALQAALIGVPEAVHVPAWGEGRAAGATGGGIGAGAAAPHVNGGAVIAAAGAAAGEAHHGAGAGGRAAGTADEPQVTEWQIFLRRLPAPAGLVSEAEWSGMSTADRELALANLAPAERFAVLRFAPGAHQAGMTGPQRFLATFGAGRGEGDCGDRTRAALALPAAVSLDLIGAVQSAYRARWPCCNSCFGVPYIIRSAWAMALVSLACTIAGVAVVASNGGRGGATGNGGFITVMRQYTSGGPSSSGCSQPYVSDSVNFGTAVGNVQATLPAMGTAFRLMLAGVIIPLPAALAAFFAVVAALNARRRVPVPRAAAAAAAGPRAGQAAAAAAAVQRAGQPVQPGAAAPRVAPAVQQAGQGAAAAAAAAPAVRPGVAAALVQPASRKRRIITASLAVFLAGMHAVGTLCTTAAVGMLQLTDLPANAAAAYCANQARPSAGYSFFCVPGDAWMAQYSAAPYVQAAASFMLCWGVIIAVRS